MWTRLRLWFAALSRRTRFEHELDDELAFHMQSRAEEWERRGLPAAAARRRARLEFSNVERINRGRARSACTVSAHVDLDYHLGGFGTPALAS